MTETRHTRARFGEFEADLTTGRLTQSGRSVAIQRQPFEALRLLLIAEGGLVTREMFQQTLWPKAVHVDFERGLTSAIRKVREALQDSGRSSRFVETLPGRGYRFMCPVEWGSDKTTSVGGRDRDAGAGISEGRSWRASMAAAMFVGVVGGVAVGTSFSASVRGTIGSAEDTPINPSRVSTALSRASVVPAARTAWSAAVPLLSSDRNEALRDAMRWFDRAAEFDPAFADAYAGGAEARVYLAADESAASGAALLADARTRAQRALSLDAGSARARVVLARLLMAQDAFDDAADELTRAISADASFAPAYTALACVRKHQGRMLDAAELAEQALRLTPDDAPTVALAGFFAHSAGRYQRERELLDRAAVMDPASVAVLWHVALGEARRADYVGALTNLHRALALSPEAPRLLYWRGYVEIEAGRISDARKTLAALTKISRNAAGEKNIASLRWMIQEKSRRSL